VRPATSGRVLAFAALAMAVEYDEDRSEKRR
jgi:hypothetical protein